MSKAAKDDDEKVSSGPSVRSRGSLQDAFDDWKRRQGAKAQPKGGASVSSPGFKGAKDRPDDLPDAKATPATGSEAKKSAPAPYVAEANRPKVRPLWPQFYTQANQLQLFRPRGTCSIKLSTGTRPT